MPMCLVNQEATTIRTRLCIQPSCQSWRMPASTSGTPVTPRCHASSPAGSVRQGIASNFGLKLACRLSGQWCST